MIEKEFRGQIFKFMETKTAPALVEEIFSDNYKVFESGLEVLRGDIILDLGANEGMFSIMMGKLFPEASIIAYEPVPETFGVLCKNIEANDARNVTAYQFGAGAPGDSLVEMNVSKDYSGGSTSKCTFVSGDHKKVDAHLVSLDKIFKAHNISRCKLMKVDIEGMEYEALYYTSVLDRVDNMAIEVHMNHRLEFEGRRADGLITWLSERTNLIHVELCRMAE